MANWTDTIFKFIGHSRYNSALPSVGSGSASELQCDSSGRLIVSVGADTALKSSLTTWQKAPNTGSAGLSKRAFTLTATKRVRRVIVSSGYGTARYFQLHDLLATTDLSGSSIPLFSTYISANGNYAYDFGEPGLSLSLGLVWVVSTTLNVNTEDASALFLAWAEVVT